MAYVAVKGGQKAIDESIKLLKYYRTEGEEEISISALKNNMKLLCDRVMSEAGLYSPTYAALALKQCEGSLEEAVFIMRAYRSTLSRNHFTKILDTENIRITRRISAAFKDIPGGQILGPTYDYMHRLMDFDLMENKREEDSLWRRQYEESGDKDIEINKFPRVSSILKDDGLLEGKRGEEEEIFDVTLNKMVFPAKRSARLQTLQRADTGYVSGLAYSSLRGFGSVHPTVGELRTGYLSIEIPYLLDDNEEIFVGEILITEVETFVATKVKTKEKHDRMEVGIGYGCVFGRNETKAIAISILDRALEVGGDSPVNDEEFVLLHGDSLEMNGFISHLKLPHYITFQSKLDVLRRKKKDNE